LEIFPNGECIRAGPEATSPHHC